MYFFVFVLYCTSSCVFINYFKPIYIETIYCWMKNNVLETAGVILEAETEAKKLQRDTGGENEREGRTKAIDQGGKVKCDVPMTDAHYNT